VCRRGSDAELLGAKPGFSARTTHVTLGRLKMQDWKMTDESARLENDGLENDLFLRHTL